MVNHDGSESLLDKLILQIFEDQEDTFSFPLTTMKETRDFVRLLNRQGFTYEMICAEINEQFEAFRSWRLGGGQDTIGRTMMTRINKPLQEAMLSDGDDEEDEEALKNGTSEGKAAGGARRKKSVDGGGKRRGSRADKVDGGKTVKVKGVKVVSEEYGANKLDSKKEKVEVKSEKMDTTDGKNVLDARRNKPSNPTVLINDVQLPNGEKSENAKIAEKHIEAEKDNTGATVVAAAKDAAPNNSVKTNKDHTSKADGSRHETVKDLNAAKKDGSQEHGMPTDVKKEHESKSGKKELEMSTETKRKAKADPEPKSPVITASKLDTNEKLESSNTDSKTLSMPTKNDHRTSTGHKKEDDERMEKAIPASLTIPSTNRTFAKPSDANSPQKSPAEEGPGPLTHQAPTSSTTQSSKHGPISPTSKPHPTATESRQLLPEVQTPSNEDKNATENLPLTESPSKILETVCPPTKVPSSSAGASLAEQNSDSATPKPKTPGQNNLKTDQHSGAKVLPEECKTLSTGQKETTSPSTDNHVMAKPSTVIRSKSETIESKIAETPTAPNLTRTSSDGAEPFRPSATPASPKPDLPAAKTPPSDANQPAVDENYDSDLDPETLDRPAEDRVLIERLRSLKRNKTNDGPGHLFVFSDTPAATGTGKHRVRIGISRFPEKRLEQAQLFNPDIRMVTSVAVATRKDALCRAQEELKSMSLRGKRGWYWGSLDTILKAVTNLSVKDEAIE